MASFRGSRAPRTCGACSCPKAGKSAGADNIESIFKEAVGINVVFQNADWAGDPLHDPIASSKKGAGSARAVELGQYDLFPEDKAKETGEITAAAWMLFVYADGDDVRAELSCPIAINDEKYDGFHERILLVQKANGTARIRLRTMTSRWPTMRSLSRARVDGCCVQPAKTDLGSQAAQADRACPGERGRRVGDYDFAAGEWRERA